MSTADLDLLGVPRTAPGRPSALSSCRTGIDSAWTGKSLTWQAIPACAAAIIGALLGEATVTNVYSGHQPTHYTWLPTCPMTAISTDLLMRNKGFIRD